MDYVGYVSVGKGERKEFRFFCPSGAPEDFVERAGIAAMKAQGLLDWWYIAADAIGGVPLAQTEEKQCAACGCDMVWPHPDNPNLYISSSCYIPGCDLCYDCMKTHCIQTDCAECRKRDGDPCVYAYLAETE